MSGSRSAFIPVFNIEDSAEVERDVLLYSTIPESEASRDAMQLEQGQGTFSRGPGVYCHHADVLILAARDIVLVAL